MPHEGEHTVSGIVRDALLRIGALLDTLFETATDAIFLMDGLRFVDCNPSTLQMFGCHDKGQIVGETPLRFSPPRQPDGTSSAEKAGRLVSAAVAGEPQHFEWLHCRMDGSELDVEVRLSRCVVGGVPFLVAVVRDITERKRTETALRRQLKADELINRVLGRCAICTAGQFDRHMVSALDELARFVGADHAYFLVPDNRSTYSCTHESVGDGVAPLRGKFQNVPAGTYAALESRLLAGESLRIDSVDAYQGAERLSAAVDPGCRSLLLVPTRDSSGHFVGALGVDAHARSRQWSDSDVMLCSIIGNALTGMTERKRANERLLQEKQFSDRLIDSLPGTFYLYDSNLKLRRWNRNHEAGMGYTAADLADKGIADWQATEAGRQRVFAAARRVLEDGKQIEQFETQLKHKDGSVVPYLVSGARVDSPTGPMIVGVGINITARVEAEKALAASERNYRELFNATNDALLIHDEEGRILDVNVRACAMFGFDCAHARALTIRDLSLGDPPYDEREALERLQRALRDGPQVFDWRSRRHDGSLFWSEVALRAFDNGPERRIIASVRDITERKLAGLERERLMAEAQAASHAKDQFLAVLSHELRNPLAAIQAGIDLLHRVAPHDDPRVTRAIDAVERNVALQARLVDDLLDLSRLARGKLTLQRRPVQLDELVGAAVQGLAGDAARAGVTVEVRPGSGLWVDGDDARLQQVIVNLVGNGIKFTPHGGRVTVSTAASQQQARITVEDTGVGIEPQRLSDLFEMFQQGQIEARRAPGLGIGLALVRSIVELHGGRVWAESGGPGRGSRFTVALPACTAPRGHATAETSGARGARIKMLLVEDNDDTRFLLAETFEQLAYDVVAAESGEAALAILEREPVDIIVADIGLPGIDGYELLRRARRMPSVARVPAMALTGYGQESDIRSAREAGYTDHFVKPVDVDVLDRCIRARVAPPPSGEWARPDGHSAHP